MKALPQILLHYVVMVGKENYMGFQVFLKIVVGVFTEVFRHESICTDLGITEEGENRENILGIEKINNPILILNHC